MAEGIGRGGRGAKLLEALRAQQRQPGHQEAESSVPPLVQEIKPVPSRGRGILLPDHGTPQSASSHGAGGDGPSPLKSIGRGRGSLLAAVMAVQKPSEGAEMSPSPPKPGGRGRAALCEALRQTGNVGAEAQPVCHQSQSALTGADHLTKMVSTMQIQQKDPVIRKGTHGEEIPATANYIRLNLEPGKGVFEYEVRFNPAVDSIGIRSKMLNQHVNEIGHCKTFDGVILYLPHKLKDEVTVMSSQHPIDDSQVEVTIIFKRKKILSECIHLYNVLFRRIMNMLQLTRLNRGHFNPRDACLVPQHKLEIWPGVVTAVDEYEGGIQLCCDASHRVLRTQTVYDIMKDIGYQEPENFRDAIFKTVVGASVLTRYNNKIYRVDDIAWKTTPRSTFCTSTGEEINYAHYYKKQYGLEIHDLDQPLLVSKLKKRVENQEQERLICLIPELSYMTGLTDEMRKDFKVMKDISVYTRITPNQRQAALRKFISNIKSNERVKTLLADWGLSLEESTVNLAARIVKCEDIIFGDNRIAKGTPEADWSRSLSNNIVISAIDLMSWLVVYANRDVRYINDFLDMMTKIGPQMGIQVAQPNVVQLKDDRTETYIRALRDNIKPNVQIVVVICPTSRDDRYSAVKRLCCSEMPVASQVINTRTISKYDKLRAVVQKIALQMNCKLGGTLWAVKIPFESLMVCGIDSYHDSPKNGNSVAAFIASLNNTATRWYSQVCIQGRQQELVDGLRSCFISALKKYHEVNHKFPNRIIIFRDGVGDGQLKVCRDYEVTQFLNCFPHVSPTYSPSLTVIVCQKRITTRIFAKMNGDFANPPPGTVMDNTITRRDWYDFFLVSQNVRQGTVTPTHYVVIYDNSNLIPDHAQRITYKMCHLYYNWPGTVRVPAPCQYAHKLAHLVGQNIRRAPSEKLADRLFFL